MQLLLIHRNLLKWFSLKPEIDKLETTPVDLSKLRDAVKKINAFKTTDTSDLVKKVDYSTKNAEIEKKILDHDHNNKYITTQEFNRLTAENFAARLKKSKLSN